MPNDDTYNMNSPQPPMEPETGAGDGRSATPPEPPRGPAGPIPPEPPSVTFGESSSTSSNQWTTNSPKPHVGQWANGRYNPPSDSYRENGAQDAFQEEPPASVQSTRQPPPPPPDPPSWEQPAYRWDFDGLTGHAEPQQTPKKNRGLRVFVSIVCALVFVTMAAFAGYGVYVAVTGRLPSAPGASSSSVPGETSQPQPPNFVLNQNPSASGSEPVTPGSLSNRDIYKKVSPSIVGVMGYIDNGVYSGAATQGSGIIITADGYIVTNAHMVTGTSAQEIVLADGASYPATLIGKDDQTDLAVLKVDANDLPAAELGDSDQLEVGDRVCAIGNPGGLQLQNSLTVGYVSALNRIISTSGSGYSLECIQTDAAINPGNSGGALINEFGYVIGINSAKIAETDYEGIGFAIPITDAMPIIEQIIANGKVTGRAMLGITAKAVSVTYADYYGVPLGLQVQEVLPGSDIGAQGVRRGDIITQINDSPIYSLNACASILKEFKPGDIVTITVFRLESGNRERTFKVDIQLMGS